MSGIIAYSVLLSYTYTYMYEMQIYFLTDLQSTSSGYKIQNILWEVFQDDHTSIDDLFGNNILIIFYSPLKNAESVWLFYCILSPFFK